MDSLNKRELYNFWRNDQQVAFCANHFLFDESNSTGTIKTAAKIITSQADTLENLSHMTLSLLTAIPERRAVSNPKNKTVKFDFQLVRTNASTLVEQLHHSVVLEANAVLLLRRSHLDFNDFLKWAIRVSPEPGYRVNSPAWTKLAWQKLKAQLSEEDINKLNGYLTVYLDKSSSFRERLAAVCDMFDTVVQKQGGSDIDEWQSPSCWLHFCFALMNSQLCWPLSVIGRNKVFAHSLPIGVELVSNEKESDVIFTSCKEARFGKFIDLQEPDEAMLYGFSEGPLCWTKDWRKAFKNGLDVAKKLWQSQNSRLQSEDRKNRVRTASCEIDTEFANDIVQVLYTKSNCVRLDQRSAEAYWCQVFLGLLLPEQALPLSVATGLIDQTDSEYRLKHVECIPQKLEYASRTSLLSRLVLPNTAETHKDLKSMKSLDETENISAYSSDLESNLCSSVRAAADVMQPSGWRRVNFLGSPLVRIGFFGMLYTLHIWEEKRKKIGRAEVKNYEKLSKQLLKNRSSISISEETDFNFVEETKLGRWLGWLDHCLRKGLSADGLNQSKGPGLGILCIRVREKSSPMRFWSDLFQLLDANQKHWEKFQWADKTRAASLLGELLNNFGATENISYSAPPDLIVVLDDSGLTKKPKVDRSSDDFRGDLHEFLHPRSDLASKIEPADESRKNLLSGNRILVIQTARSTSHVSNSQDVLSTNDVIENIENLDFNRLKVFRYGFSIHSAFSVLTVGKKTDEKSWSAVRQRIEEWERESLLMYHRGEYFLPQRSVPSALFGNEMGALHLAAAKSFAPLLNPGRVDLSISRDRAMEPEPYGEAIWHLYMAYKWGEKSDSQIPKYIASMAYLSNAPDWDTITLMSYDKKQRIDGLIEETVILANDLLEIEKRVSNKNPHAQRYAKAINVCANLLRGTMSKERDYGWKSSLTALKLIDIYGQVNIWFRLVCEDADDNSDDEAGACRKKIYLFGEYAYFLLHLYRCLVVDKSYLKVSKEIDKERKKLEQFLSQKMELLLEEKLKAENAPFPHGWLKEKLDAAKESEQRLRYALCMCLTDEQPAVESFILLFSTLEMSEIHLPYMKKSLGIWDDVSTVYRDFPGTLVMRPDAIHDNQRAKVNKSRRLALLNLFYWNESLLLNENEKKVVVDFIDKFSLTEDWVDLLHDLEREWFDFSKSTTQSAVASHLLDRLASCDWVEIIGGKDKPINKRRNQAIGILDRLSKLANGSPLDTTSIGLHETWQTKGEHLRSLISCSSLKKDSPLP